MPELSIKLSKRTQGGEDALSVWTLGDANTRPIMALRPTVPFGSARVLQEFDKVGIRTDVGRSNLHDQQRMLSSIAASSAITWHSDVLLE